MGGGALPTPATTVSTAGKHQSPPPRSPFSSNFSAKYSDFVGESEKRASVYSNEINFGSVPSQIEVQNAISDLRRVMNGFCERSSEISGDGEIMKQLWEYDCSRSLLKSLGQKRLFDAYHLLQTDDSVQRLVISISTDSGVWDAIMKNNAVQDLSGSLLHTGDLATPFAVVANEGKTISYKQEIDSISLIMNWIMRITKAKIMEFIEKLGLFVIETLKPASKKDKPTSELDDLLQEKVRSSVLLSVVILLIVGVTRSNET